jgi:pimeloyl-ACP methyl ester carboxylesterase
MKYKNIRRKNITVGDIDISYLTGGEGDPLVVVHGGGDGADSWLHNAEDLSNHYRVYVPELPGFGKTPPRGDGFHMPELTAFVRDFAEHLELDHFHLLGHSIGGGIALQYAFKFPQKVKGLVLVSSFGLGKEIAFWVRFLSQPVFCHSIGRMILGMQKAIKWLVRLVYAPFTFVNPITRYKMDIGMKVTSLNGQTNVDKHRLGELTMPTVLIWGERDLIVPVSQAYAAAELIPDCQLHVFDNCGHSVYKQRVHEFSSVLTKHLP